MNMLTSSSLSGTSLAKVKYYVQLVTTLLLTCCVRASDSLIIPKFADEQGLKIAIFYSISSE